jgi:LysM repeat protein
MFDLIGKPKMIIHAYSDPTFRDKVDEFAVLLNPENYSLNYEIQFQDNQAPGTSGSELTFEMIKPQQLEFEFLFDRTGAIVGSGDVGDDGVHSDIDYFKNLTIGFDGSTHRTKYLILAWGKLLFKCCCTSLNVTYKLFRPDGVPLRAVAKAKFEEFRETGQRVREENKNSPDLTHVRMVKHGDTLPLMTHTIYGDSKYYLQVAKANQLTNFRKLKVGQKIVFPPLEK